nr:GNAT family N-acetyltransferase [Paenarthrobacter nitroguajacolicus]
MMAEEVRRVTVRRAELPGDLGWIVQAHGEVFAELCAWGQDFEGFVASIVSDYTKPADIGRQEAWIAEVDGERAGCIMLMPHDERTAKLRVLLVTPLARGLGVGARLIEEHLRFARTAGYEHVSLWTTNNLTAARRLYERAGFELQSESPTHLFGGDHMEQTWVLDL